MTGRTGRLAHFVGFKPQQADFSKIIEEPEKHCPFCPGSVQELTPKFSPEEIPEGRLIKGESVLFPNLLPYDEHSALTVLCREHFKKLSEFSAEIFKNAFENCLDYFDRVIEDKKEKFVLLTWNYMPAAGSSQVHPHFQVYASINPGNFLQNMLKESKIYYQEKSKPYWEDFLLAEKDSGERLVQEGKKSV